MYPFKTHAILICILSAILCTACVREDTEGCVQYALNVQAVDAEGNDLTSSGVLQKTDVYLFDEKGFVRMVPAGTSSDFLFGEDKNARLTLVAWGNLKEDTLITTELTRGTSMEEAKVQLRRYAEGTHIPVTDLFYSCKELSRPQTRSMQEETLTLIMERMAACVSIRTRYLAERYPYMGEPYHFIVRGTGTEIDFTGNVAGEETGYEPASTTSDQGDVYAPSFHVFPMLENGRIEIDLYRKEEKIYTITEDNNFQPLKVTVGKQTNIDIDFRYAEIKVFITVTPWGEVWQDTEM